MRTDTACSIANICRAFLAAGTLTALAAFAGGVRSAFAGEASLYAVAERPAPVLNTPDFFSVFGGADGRTLKTDRSGLIREVEFVALPGTVFEIESTYRDAGVLIYKVRTTEYPSGAEGLYVDSRFVKVSNQPPAPRRKLLPPKKTILERMQRNVGAPYVWGANAAEGIPELLRFYPPEGKIPAGERDLWTLKGLDCSGLLYEAADGTTPRNTSALIHFGKAVPVKGLTARQIAARLEPLDLIVWKGHVIIVLDKTHTIESCQSCSERGGVTVRGLLTVLGQIMETRTPENVYPTSGRAFVVRRWYPDAQPPKPRPQ